MSESTPHKLNNLSCCVIIPTYNNEKTVAQVVHDVKAYAENVIVVNDGSTDGTVAILNDISGIEVIGYPKNRGKGFALQTGFRHAWERGFGYAITIDSDGQHFASDIPLFVEAMEQNPGALIVGSRNLEQENMPGKNSFANKFSNFWFRLETGKRLNDTQSGFRAYPLAANAKSRFFTKKYDFELEILVRSAWKGVPIVSIPIQVFYAPEGERVSHFKPVRDFTRISLLNTVLVLIAFLWVKPFHFVKKLTKKNIRQFVNDHIIHSPEPNSKIALSVTLGVFMGIVPVWGYQMIIAFTLAHLLKLNKVITLVASNISIPPMIPFILFGSFATGAWVMNRPLTLSLDNISFETVTQHLLQYVLGSFIFAIACAVVLGGLTYLILSIFRKTKVK